MGFVGFGNEVGGVSHDSLDSIEQAIAGVLIFDHVLEAADQDSIQFTSHAIGIRDGLLLS